MARANAYAKGHRLPRAGSFHDALLEEMDLRERDIRYSEVMIGLTAFQLFAEDVRDLLMAGFALKSSEQPRFSRERLEKLTSVYRDKLFHIGYLPEYERRLAEILHGKPAELREETERDISAASKVERMTDTEPLG